MVKNLIQPYNPASNYRKSGLRTVLPAMFGGLLGLIVLSTLMRQQMTQQMLRNSKQGGFAATKMRHWSTTYTVAAAHYGRADQLTSISDDIVARMTEEAFYPQFDAYSVQVECSGTKPFSLVLATVLVKEDTSITAYDIDANTESPIDVLGTMIGGDHIAAISPPIFAKRFMDNGTARYALSGAVELRAKANTYATEVAKRDMFAGEEPGFALICIFYSEADQTISIAATHSIVAKLVQRPSNLI
jgi:uncharacterized protein YdeI (BOF family)